MPLAFLADPLDATDGAFREVVLIANGGERYLSTPYGSDTVAVTVRLPGALRDATGGQTKLQVLPAMAGGSA